MTFLTQQTGFVFLAIFAIVMIAITYFFTRSQSGEWTRESFLVANRNVPWWLGGPSIAASWIWAGALFVSTQMAFEKGLAGIFWFTFPNVLALILFAIWAPKIKEKFPQGYTLPQFIREKFQSKKLHALYLIPFFFNQILAITFNVFAGGAMLSLLTGISLTTLIPILAGIALLYTLISGVRASIVTDMVQMILIIGGIIIIVPWAIMNGGGFAAVAGGFGGVTGALTNIFNPGVMFSLGIINSIGLISGTIVDQQYWQRTFALRTGHLRRSFTFGGILFAIVPILLGCLGFLAANPALGVLIPSGTDMSLTGVLTVAHLLPHAVTVIFVIIMMAGLSSTIDSGISAASSLWVTDVQHKTRVIPTARWAMFFTTLAAVAIAYGAHFIDGIGLQHLWFLSISMVASVSVPTVIALYKDNLSVNGYFWGILLAIIVGMPLFFYANIIGNTALQVTASITMIVISTIGALSKRK